MSEDIQIFVPPSADMTDLLDMSLVTLTEAIAQIDSEAVAHGFLGGEFGYGARYENHVFMMHPYCWCERTDCLWCCVWLSNETECSEERAEAHRQWQVHQIRDKYGEWAAAYPGAPNFWHKASGLQARWYKWIGRGMETNVAADHDVAAIMRECMESLAPIADGARGEG